MNWKRGLLRLWAVAAVLWVGVAFYSNDTVQRVRDAYEKVVRLNADAEICSKLQTPSFTPDACSAAASTTRLTPAETKELADLEAEFGFSPSAAAPLKPSIWPPLFDFAKLAFIPPLFLLALGYIGLWVGRGFRR
jgi:hypothetical protein